MKPVQCKNCKYFKVADGYKYEGVCLKDNSYTRDLRSCDKLKTNAERKEAKRK